MVYIRLNVIKKESLSSHILDLLRFIAAAIVLLYHFGWTQLPGYQFVMVFFVLSGYFISLSVLKDVKEGKWSWKTYLTKRLVRLYIVLLPGLALTFVLAKIQIHLFGGSEFFQGNLNVKTLIGNVFFLQSIKVHQFGLNGPLWSLSYEFWYYILFPCIVLFFHSKTIMKKIMYFILFVGIALFVGKTILMYFVVWMIGSVICVLDKPDIQKHLIKYGAFVFLLIVSAISTKGLYTLYSSKPTWVNPIFLPDLSVGICFGLLIYWITVIFNWKSRITKYNVSKKLASFSFTLYLIHYPFLYLYREWEKSSYWSFGLTEGCYIKILYVMIVFTICYLFSLVTEKNILLVTNKFINLIEYKKEKHG